MNTDVNNKFNDKGEKPRFMYKQSPVKAHDYQIFEFKEEKQTYEPAGEYLLLDSEEKPELTQKKISNLVRLLNGKKDLEELGKLTNTRLLFNIVPRTNDNDATKIIFRTHDGDGISTENAMFTIEKGILDEN